MTPGDPPPTEEPLDEEPVSPESDISEKWILTKEALDKLLEQFSPDREEAGRKYVLMQAKLIRYFECRSSPSPEDEAQTTINRVARRIHEGKKIENLPAYFYKVAAFVLFEARRRPERTTSGDLPDIPVEPPPLEDPKEARMQCLDQCLEKLSAENRRLILEYYADEKRAKINHRRDLAEGSNLNALRIRTCRIRKILEECVKDCLKNLDDSK